MQAIKFFRGTRNFILAPTVVAGLVLVGGEVKAQAAPTNPSMPSLAIPVIFQDNDDGSEPLVTLVLSPPIIQEDGGRRGSATLSAVLSPVAATATIIRVSLTPLAPATTGDYKAPSNVLTIAAGKSASSNRVTITAVDNDINNVNREISISATAEGGAVTITNELPLILTIVDDEMDVTAPEVVSIARGVPSGEHTNADSLEWLVTFSQDVVNVNEADFAVGLPAGETGATTTATVTNVTGSGTQWRVTASGGDLATYNGRVGLEITTGRDIQDTSVNPGANSLTNTIPTGANEAYTMDNNAPTVMVAAQPEFVGAPFDVTITFSEPVTGFGDDGDITATNATVSAAVPGGGVPNTTWTATVTPAGVAAYDRMDISLRVGAGVAADQAGNGNEASDDVVVPYNEPEITLVLSSPTIQENGGPSGSATLSATLDPAAATDTMITVWLNPLGYAKMGDYLFPTNVLTIAAGKSTSDTLTITAVDNAVNNVNREINIAATAAGGAVAITNDFLLTLTIVDDEMDVTAPEVVSIARGVPSEELTNADSLEWLVTFSEDVAKVNAADFAVGLPAGETGTPPTTTVTNVAGSGMQWRVTASGGDLSTYSGRVGLEIAAGNDIRDTSVNPRANALINTTPTGANETYMMDNNAPTVMVAPQSAFVDVPFDVTITFSDPAPGFGDDGDITVTNATIGAAALMGGGIPNTTWTATVTPAAAAPNDREDIVISIAAGVATDQAGNGNEALDVVVPYNEPEITLVLSSPMIQENGGPRGAATLSATLDPVAATDTMITVILTSLGSATASDYVFPNNTLAIAAGESTSDTLTITAVNNSINNVNRVINISATAAGGAVTITNDFLLTLTIVDDKMNAVAPEVVSIARGMPSGEHTNADSLEWLVTFSEGVVNVNEADFAVGLPTGETGTPTTATVTGVTGSGTQWRVTASGGDLGAYNGGVGLELKTGNDIRDTSVKPVANALTNAIPTGANEAYTVDNNAPTVVVAAQPEFVDAPFDVTITFSEPVTGFGDDGDITATNATAGAAVPGGGVPNTTWTATVTPAGVAADDRMDITLRVGAGVAADQAGNGNEASDDVVVPYNEPEITLVLSSPTIQENGGPSGSATLSATLDPVAATDTVITVSLTPLGSATMGDYLFPTKVLTIAAGERAGNELTITAVNNAINNVNREISIAAKATGGAVTITNELPLTLTIVDDKMDAVAPEVVSIARGMPSDEHTNADSLEWLVTFSEDAANVNEADFAVGLPTGETGTPTTATVTNVTGGGTQWRVTASGGDLSTYNGRVVLEIAAGHDIQDTSVNPVANALINAAPTGANETYTMDNNAPTVMVAAQSEFLDAPFDVTITFSEPVTGFGDDGDITATNATVGMAVPGGGVPSTTWTATVTPAAAAPSDREDIAISITADVAADRAENGNEASDEPVIVRYQNGFLDGFANPSPFITAITRLNPISQFTNLNSLTWQVVFNEPVTGVDDAHFIVTDEDGVALEAPSVNGSGRSWTVTTSDPVLEDYDGSVRIALALDQDIMGMGSTPAQLLDFTGAAEPYTLDNTGPELTAIEAADMAGKNGTTPVAFVFDSNDVAPLVLGDISISPSTGGRINNNLQANSRQYSGTFTAGSELGEVTITLAAGNYQDWAGNPGTTTRSLTLTVVDAPRATLSVSQRFAASGTGFPVTIQFDQNVTGFNVAEDVMVTHGTASAPTPIGESQSEYTTTITPSGDGMVTVSVQAGVAMSTETRSGNVASNRLSVLLEPAGDTNKVGAPRLASVKIPPEMIRNGATLSPNDALDFVVTFDEPVSVETVNSDDFAPPKGFVCKVGPNPNEYDKDHVVSYTLMDGAVQAIQDITAKLTSTTTITDQTGEMLTIVEPTGTAETHVNVAVHTTALSKSLENVAVAGELAVSIVSDGALSPPLDIVEVRFGERATYNPHAPGALLLEGAALESAVETRAGFIWALTLRPDTGATMVTVTVPANQASDGVDTNEEVTAAFTMTQPRNEPEIVADFMQRRGAHIMAARPNLLCLLNCGGIGTLSLKLDDGPTRAFSFAGTWSEISGLSSKAPQGLSLREGDHAEARGDLWMSLTGIQTRTDDAKDDFHSLSVGVHQSVGDDHIAGGFIAVDQTDASGRGTARDDSVEGVGWLVGPYLAGRLAERGLYYQVHAAWGRSSNDISLDGAAASNFKTRRYLVGGELKGSFQAGPWILTPALSVDWYHEEQRAYMSGGVRVAGQRISLGEIRAGPEFQRVSRLENGADLSVKMGVHMVHNLAVDARGDTPTTYENGDTRGRTSLDFNYARNDSSVSLRLRYDGIGRTDYESWGADLQLRMTF